MDPLTRLAILLGIILLLACLGVVVIIMRSIGNTSHILSRLEEILSKETVLRYNREVAELKQQKQRSIATQEKQRRQEALLQIPLARSGAKGSK